ncbi:MAG TPA: hypothetical protein VFU43_20800 [Streptosporangiaceae bacterium]|nr:hypothetical protein [Streptosporangiaceae bacterium]
MLGPALFFRRESDTLPTSPHIKQALAEFGDFRPLVVDDAFLLHKFPPRSIREIALDFGGRRPDAQILRRPSPEDLRAAIEDADVDLRFAEYLYARVGLDRDTDFYPKIGLRSVSYETPRLGLPLTLRVAPLSFWIEAQFNRRIITDLANDPRLRRLYEDCRAEILRSWRTQRRGFSLPGPSSLFVEVALVTRDQELMLVKKSAQTGGSDSRRAGRGWSCTLEEGIRWDKADASGRLDLDAALHIGLINELDIEPEDIAETRWLGIALENHLNSALIGFARVDLPQRELRARIPNNDFEECDFVGFQQLGKIFGRDRDGIWHTTARLRAFLTFAELAGEAATKESVEHVRRKGPS